MACDTCRRKKVKCQGLPNAVSTCNNCMAYNYKCTFTADNDRSRGKYEILESKVNALLSALQNVAPNLAEDFKQGRLVVGDADESAPAEATEAVPQLVQPAATVYNNTALPLEHRPSAAGAPPGPRTGPSHFEANTMLPPLSSVLASRDLPSLEGMGLDTHMPRRVARKTHMVPDLEDGRPRFFGKSSTLSVFHSMDSRPPSPVPDRHYDSQRVPSSNSAAAVKTVATYPSGSKTASSRTGSSADLDADKRCRPSSSSWTVRIPSSGDLSIFQSGTSSVLFENTASSSQSSQRSTDWKTLPQPQPLYPSNSREWVHHLRRKNTVAIGRDDVCSDEWATRYTLPSLDLVFHLLDDIFFPHLHPLLPILHAPTFTRDIQSGRATHDTAFRGLVFCVMAISSRFSSDRRVLADPDDAGSAGDHWAAGSRLYHQAFAASLINVQMLLLTSTFMHSSVGPGSAWTILGMAIRGAIDIGLHQERAHQDFKPFDQEMRRRAFWAAFILDCIFTICLGRPSAIKLEDCHVNLPMDVSDDTLSRAEATGSTIDVDEPSHDKPTPAAGFRHMVKLNLLVHDVVSLLYVHRKPGHRVEAKSERHRSLSLSEDTHKRSGEKTVEEAQSTSAEGGKSVLERTENDHSAAGARFPSTKIMESLSQRLDDLIAEIPDHLKDVSTSPFKLQAGIISCEAHDIRLYIIKPFLADEAIHKQMHAQCITHARVCLETVVNLYEGGHLNDMVFIFMQAFMSSATFLLIVWHLTPETKMLAEDSQLIEQTAHMMSMVFDERYCSSVVRKAWRILQRVALRAMSYMDDDVRQRTQRWISTARIGAEALLPASVFSNLQGNSQERDRAAVPVSQVLAAEGDGGEPDGVAATVGSNTPLEYSFVPGATPGPCPNSNIGVLGPSNEPIDPRAGSPPQVFGSPTLSWMTTDASASANNPRKENLRQSDRAGRNYSFWASPSASSHDHWAKLGASGLLSPSHNPANNKPWSAPSQQAAMPTLAMGPRWGNAMTSTTQLTAAAVVMPFELNNFGDVNIILGDPPLGRGGEVGMGSPGRGNNTALMGHELGPDFLGGLDVSGGGIAAPVANGETYSYLGSEGLWQDWFLKNLDSEVRQ